ncbi:MAG: alpha/beta hydrolase [Candidatus Eremiobacteraeota bacterium]|nr:alpha/beta hydrolase [Candidatus Eremiobacteraeota bacterium]
MLFDHPDHIDPRSGERRFEYAAGAPTVVFFHGLTATPHQFDALAPMVRMRGRNVLVPRLPRHGYHNRMTTALADLELAELIAAVKLSLAEARALGGPVTVAGFSLGGLLAAYVAQREEVARAVAIAPFLGVRWLPRVVNRSGASVLRHIPDLFLWWDPVKRERHGGEVGYPRYPISAVRKAFVLGAAILEDALVRAPLTPEIVLVTNPYELTCHNGLVHELAERWRARGAAVAERELEGLGPSHDFVTPRRDSRRRARMRERVYPALVEAIVA